MHSLNNLDQAFTHDIPAMLVDKIGEPISARSSICIGRPKRILYFFLSRYFAHHDVVFLGEHFPDFLEEGGLDSSIKVGWVEQRVSNFIFQVFSTRFMSNKLATVPAFLSNKKEKMGYNWRGPP